MSATAEENDCSLLHNHSCNLARNLSNLSKDQNNINEKSNDNQNQEPAIPVLLDNNSNDSESQSSSRAHLLSIKNEKINSLENKIKDLNKIILEKDNEIKKLNNIISQKDKEIETFLKISSINAFSACSQLSKDLFISDFIHTEIKAQNKKKKVISFINNYLDDYKEINKNNNKNIPKNIEEDNIKFTLFVTQFNRDKAAELLLKENL